MLNLHVDRKGRLAALKSRKVHISIRQPGVSYFQHLSQEEIRKKHLLNHLLNHSSLEEGPKIREKNMLTSSFPMHQVGIPKDIRLVLLFLP